MDKFRLALSNKCTDWAETRLCSNGWSRKRWDVSGSCSYNSNRKYTIRTYVDYLCLLVFVWPGTSVLGRRHTHVFKRSKMLAPLVHGQIMCCSTLTQHIWRQKLCCHRATCLEQPPSTLAWWRH